jgi:pimeloyl-ACP methyl ester carboxylesterase
MRAVAVSARGHGDSDTRATGDQVEDFAADVVALRDARGHRTRTSRRRRARAWPFAGRHRPRPGCPPCARTLATSTPCLGGQGAVDRVPSTLPFHAAAGRPAGRPASSTSMTEAAPWPIWPSGMSTGPRCSVVATRPPASSPSAAWSTPQMVEPYAPPDGCSVSSTTAASRRGQRAVDRMRLRSPNAHMVQLPVQAFEQFLRNAPFMCSKRVARGQIDA